MGMFDSVHITCPTCKHLVEFQSKVGECWLHDYPEYSVPPHIAADVDGDMQECETCGERIVVRGPQPGHVTVQGYIYQQPQPEDEEED